MLRWLVLVFCTIPLLAQTEAGELRVAVTDPTGLPLPASVELVSEANQFRRSYQCGPDGKVTAKRLPFGLYRIQVQRPGFAPLSEMIEVRSAVPLDRHVTLGIAAVETAMVVNDAQTLLDSSRTGSINRIGAETLADRPTSQPGRSVIDLINMEPGWLLEAGGVLHPRGSEYQTQFVVDGIPLTDNRSPGFAPEINADDVRSMTILTAGYPAEYGRKLGGVIEVTTERDPRPGFHGKVELSGGSFDTSSAFLMGQYGWGRNTFTISGNGDMTDRFLDPPVEQNFTNHGTASGFTAHYERDLNDSNRIGFILRRDESRFLVPNEMVQQAAGQRQDRNDFETAGTFSYQHIFSPNVIGDLRMMGRDASANLWSNPLSTPIQAYQQREYREEYVKGSISMHSGHHELKFGTEGDFASIHENFNDRITDRSAFDPDTPRRFAFRGFSHDREQSLFAQDQMRFGPWSISAGLRWDRYRLVVDESAVSPRLGVAYYWRKADLVFRASYDRVFQTPAVENLLLASSPAVDVLNDTVLRLPVKPSLGNYYEAGLSKGLFGKMRLDANYFRRNVNNFADDDVFLNTGVSFPIAFQSAQVRGVEAKLEIPRWGPVSGFLSYANQLGVGYLPVTGGLFLGDDVSGSLATGSFPITQDQRNTARARFRYQLIPRAWIAIGGTYGSGLPVEFNGDPATALAQYGQRIVDKVNFSAGRVRPSFSLDVSAGIDLIKHEKRDVRFQADVMNATNRLNVIDFAGLFSGTALAAPRSFGLRLSADF
ncbi:MAG TPA: TonB-dependent receptor [Bryobacteraceae bacterium]